MRISLIAFLGLLAFSGAAQASPAEVREVARLNNCPPQSIEIFQQTVGARAQTIYRVSCDIPASLSKDAPPPVNAILVRCLGTLCDVMRTLYKQDSAP
ncbi:MAG: hypothetical protein FWF24_06370 [Alphaproteobacteria bacterium]|nr:hypothetical protein [Alphaproteobacteria bacterium]